MVRGSHLAFLIVVGSLLSANWMAHAEPRGSQSLGGAAQTFLALPEKAESQATEIQASTGSPEARTEAPAKLVESSDDPAGDRADDGRADTARNVSIPPEWYVRDDYAAAMKEATEDRKMLLIYFYDRTPNSAQRAFEIETLANLEIQEKLKRYVFVKLPRDTRIRTGGKSDRAASSTRRSPKCSAARG